MEYVIMYFGTLFVGLLLFLSKKARRALAVLTAGATAVMLYFGIFAGLL